MPVRLKRLRSPSVEALSRSAQHQRFGPSKGCGQLERPFCSAFAIECTAPRYFAHAFRQAEAMPMQSVSNLLRSDFSRAQRAKKWPLGDSNPDAFRHKILSVPSGTPESDWFLSDRFTRARLIAKRSFSVCLTVSELWKHNIPVTAESRGPHCGQV